MAITNAQKAAFLESIGEKKSLHYFMTGPNLGQDWSWSKALAGGYSSDEVSEFLSKANTAYTGHKTKDAATPADPGSGPDLPNGMSGACAKTTAKALVSAASQAKQAVTQVIAHLYPLQGVKGLTVIIDDAPALQKKLSVLLKDIMVEVGEGSAEQFAVEAAQAALHASTSMAQAGKVLSGWQQGDFSDLIFFQDMDSLAAGIRNWRGKLMQNLISLDNLTSDTFGVGGADMAKMIGGWADEITERMDAVAWNKLISVTDASDDQYFSIFKMSAKYYDPAISHQALSKLWGDIDQLATVLGFTDEGFATTEMVATLSRTNLMQTAKEAVEAIDQELKDKIAELTTVQGWLNGDVLQPDSYLHKWTDFDSFVSDLNKHENATQALESIGMMKHEPFSDSLLQEVETAFEQAMELAQSQIPGPTPTGSALKQLLELPQENVVLAAGTDELNPMVQAVLEQMDETPSLTYFMSKQQKIDLLTDPDGFTTKNYSITYKGQTLEGPGLETAQTKYAMKNGAPAPKATVFDTQMGASVDEAVAKASETPVMTATGTVPVTGQPVPLPPGSPKWYADPYTDKQKSFLGSLVEKHQVTPVLDAGGWWVQAGAGLTKGQVSILIDMLKTHGDNLSAADVKIAIKYGVDQVPASAVSQAAQQVDEIPGASVTDVLSDAQHGPVVSGHKAATSTAPDNPVWDAPHSYTYLGDGQSKWGGAHRKWWFQDEEGNDWMLKHGADFRAEGELAAHKMAHAVGFDVAEARIVELTIEGGRKQKGIIQRMHRSDDVVGTFDSVAGMSGSVAGVDAKILQQIQQHQVLDWLIGNHDSHAQNFMILRDGRVVGVDKGQAFKFYGKDQLAHDYRPRGNHGEIVYNRMWDDYRAGRIDLDLDVVDDALSRIEQMSDDQVREMVRAYSAGRFRAPASEAFLEGTSSTSASVLEQAVIARKNSIRVEFTSFYRVQAGARGKSWTPSWEKAVKVSIHEAKPSITSPTQILTPIDEMLAASLNRVGTNGKAVYVAGAEVERGQILFDLVQLNDGKKFTRMNVHLRPEGNTKMMKIIEAEGGADVLKTTQAVSHAPDVPVEVQQLSQWSNKTTSAAKTINHHITSGDFEFNQSTLQAANQVLSEIESDRLLFTLFERGYESVEAVEDVTPDFFKVKLSDLETLASRNPSDVEVREFVTKQAGRATQLRAGFHYRSYLKEIAEQGQAGTGAGKVSLVTHFDAEAYFRQVRDEAIEKVDNLRAGVTQVVVEEPERIFNVVRSQDVTTTAVLKGRGRGVGQDGLNDPVGLFEGWREVSGARGEREFFMEATINGKKAEIAYRTTDIDKPTMKGWLEVLYDNETTGEVSAEDLGALHGWLNERLGVSARLANSVDIELTYWRMVQGNYDLAVAHPSYSRAQDLARARLSQLGAAPTEADEIEAIKGAYREVFGNTVDQADVLPIHSHMTSPELDEIGWGYWERPEISDAQMDAMRDRIIFHDLSYNSSEFTLEHMGASTGQGLMSQQERWRSGFSVRAASAEADLGGGGAAGLFGRVSTTAPYSSADFAVIAPHRRARRLLDYNSTHDVYGRLSDRTSVNTLDVADLAKRSSGNEVMMRDLVSYMDDVEVAFIGNQSVREGIIQTLHSRGVTAIRGVAVEERFVYSGAMRNKDEYVKEFFRKYVNPRERLRRGIDEFRKAAGTVTQQVRETVMGMTSRLRVKQGMVTRMSKGRPTPLRLRSVSGPSRTVVVRYHTSENVMSLPVEMVDDGIDALSSRLVEAGHPPLKKAFYTQAEEASGAGNAISASGEFTVIDFSTFGIDIKIMSPTARARFMQQFLDSLSYGDSGLDYLRTTIARWGGQLA